ncbi:MAG TPA: alpha-amylase family glycosyl hydrolase, partial [Ilumatobacteraceae bacterium]
MLAAAAGISMAVATGPLPRAAADTSSVTIAGSLQSELGCPGDWQPECADTHLAYDAADDVWQATFPLPAGSYEYKAALNGTWNENYGANAARDGANIPLVLDDDTSVKFYFDDETNWVTDNATTVIAVAPGDFQSELGCPGDWDPACLRSWLQDIDGDGLHRLSTSQLPVGDYQFKVAIGESWDENYGRDGVRGGDNMSFSIGAPGDTVTITYNERNHMTRVSVVPATPPVVDDTALVAEPIRHPVVDEVLYFAIPDRYFDGNPENNCGFYTPVCTPNGTQEEVLANGYLPSQQGYYHGGDLAGLREKLPYLEELGMTAIWVGPIFKNKPTQSDTTDLYGHSAGYHGYWITDFLNVDPHLGTNEEFRALVDDAHARGIKVFMDVVTNHTADVIQLVDNAGYRNKRDFPYTDTSGQPFDDSDFAYAGQADYDFPDVDLTSFPYDPVVPAGETKNPSWLNDPTLYHNRGNTGFIGENSLYGDFFGLDDLWTERREVVEGMVDIYSHWVEEYSVDGFRIDTTKHVNMEFWQVFGPDIVAAAAARGIDHFFAFGEVFDQQFGSPFMSEFSTEGKLQSTIDFGFQVAARNFASRSTASDGLRAFFESDDYYTDSDSNAYAQPTFLGNHDMGRIGFLVRDQDALARDLLAHELLFLARGQPVVYAGDEQGFVGTGDGTDRHARQSLFATQTPEYAVQQLITGETVGRVDRYDTDAPLYTHVAELAALRSAHPALATGAQVERLAEGSTYAFSRIDHDERVEHLVVLNASANAVTVEVPTLTRDAAFEVL